MKYNHDWRSFVQSLLSEGIALRNIAFHVAICAKGYQFMIQAYGGAQRCLHTLFYQYTWLKWVVFLKLPWTIACYLVSARDSMFWYRVTYKERNNTLCFGLFVIKITGQVDIIIMYTANAIFIFDWFNLFNRLTDKIAKSKPYLSQEWQIALENCIYYLFWANSSFQISHEHLS